jgi:hypothetical protein
VVTTIWLCRVRPKGAVQTGPLCWIVRYEIGGHAQCQQEPAHDVGGGAGVRPHRAEIGVELAVRELVGQLVGQPQRERRLADPDRPTDQQRHPHRFGLPDQLRRTGQHLPSADERVRAHRQLGGRRQVIRRARAGPGRCDVEGLVLGGRAEQQAIVPGFRRRPHVCRDRAPPALPVRAVATARGHEGQRHRQRRQPMTAGRARQHGRSEQCGTREFAIAGIARTISQCTQILSECGDRTIGGVQWSLGSTHTISPLDGATLRCVV